MFKSALAAAAAIRLSRSNAVIIIVEYRKDGLISTTQNMYFRSSKMNTRGGSSSGDETTTDDESSEDEPFTDLKTLAAQADLPNDFWQVYACIYTEQQLIDPALIPENWQPNRYHHLLVQSG
jgi:hypothetical protein